MVIARELFRSDQDLKKKKKTNKKMKREYSKCFVKIQDNTAHFFQNL